MYGYNAIVIWNLGKLEQFSNLKSQKTWNGTYIILPNHLLSLLQ